LGFQGGTDGRGGRIEEARVAGRIAGVRAIDDFREIVPLVGVRIRIGRVGAELDFQFIIQAIPVVIFYQHDGCGIPSRKDGLGRQGEAEGEEETKGEMSWVRHDAKEMVVSPGQNNPPCLRTL
jgi:hypothetical protein